MKFKIILILSFALTIKLSASDKKYVKDFDGDLVDDYVIFRHNDSKQIFESVDIKLSNLGNFKLETNSGFDYVPNQSDLLENADNWDVRNCQMFYLLISNKIHYLIFYHLDKDENFGNKTIVRIDKENHSVVFDKPFSISKILPSGDSFDVYGLYKKPKQYRDTLIAKRKYGLSEYVHYLCYTITDSSRIDLNKSISYNQNYFVGWAVSKKRKVVIDKQTKEQKFLFELYRKYPETSLRELSRTDLSIYSKDELRIMRNEIFADYGYIFNDEYLNWYFNQLDWYQEEDKDVEVDLDQIETKNINLIRTIENE